MAAAADDVSRQLQQLDASGTTAIWAFFTGELAQSST